MKRAAPQLYLERDTSLYRVRGQRVPSVTEILALAGVVDFAGVPAELLEQAAARGRAVHALTAALDEARPEDGGLDVPPELAGYVSAWTRFRDETKFDPELIEYALVNHEHRFAGTLDRFGEMGGELAVIDLKTSATVAPYVGLQLAGYELALRPTLHPREAARVRRYAVRLSRDGRYTLHPFTSRADHADFLGCVRVAHWHLNHGGYVLT